MKKKMIQFLCVIVFIYSAFELIQYAKTYADTEQELQQVQQFYEETQDIKEQQSQMIQPRFEKLQTINENIVGWITIPNSQLNNPVMYSGDNDYYLHHNYLDEESRAGSVFMDFRNDVEGLGRHTILYGHVMRNGSMFGEIAKFAEQSYADEHSVMTFSTLYGNYELQVFAAYETTTDFYYIETDFTDDAAFGQFLTEIQKRSVISMPVDVDVTATDQILTLSTCTTSLADNERFVVHAKLVKK